MSAARCGIPLPVSKVTVGMGRLLPEVATRGLTAAFRLRRGVFAIRTVGGRKKVGVARLALDQGKVIAPALAVGMEITRRARSWREPLASRKTVAHVRDEIASA